MKQVKSTVALLVFAGAVFSVSSICISGPVMVEKNLFAQDRKPPGPDSAAPPPPQSNTPGLSAKSVQLDGVLIHGHTKKAVVRFKGGQPSQGQHGKDKGKSELPFKTVQEGEKIGDYLVKKIESRSISLEKDGQVVTVSLFAEGKVVPPPPPVPASPSGPAAQGGDPNRQKGGQPPQAGNPRNRREGELPDPNARHAGRMPPPRDQEMSTDDLDDGMSLDDDAAMDDGLSE